MILLRGLFWAGFFYALPWVALMMLDGIMRNPGVLVLFGVMLVVAVVGPIVTAPSPVRTAEARRAAYEAFRNAREVDEEIRLVMSPDFDMDQSVVPRGRVGAHRRRPGSWRKRRLVSPDGWREAVWPPIRRKRRWVS